MTADYEQLGCIFQTFWLLVIVFIIGCILGSVITVKNILVATAIGDALGVPFENKSSEHPALVQWDGKSYVKGRYGKGGYSDDTQLSVKVAESLIANDGFNPEDLAQRYVDWVETGEARGIGRTTFAAIQCLKKGIHWSKSGIEKSYGNGTAMRAAPFGIFYRNDIRSLMEAVKIDSAITHQSSEAESGALLIALSVYFIINGEDLNSFLSGVWQNLTPSETRQKLIMVAELLNNKAVLPKVALSLIGTSSKVQESAPAAVYTFLRMNKFTEATSTLIKAGGDTDTTCAMFGALYGAKNGLEGIAKRYLKVENYNRLWKLDHNLNKRMLKNAATR